MQKLLVSKNNFLLVAKFTFYLLHNLLLAEHYLLVAAKFAPYSLKKFVMAKNCSPLVQKISFGANAFLKPVKLVNFIFSSINTEKDSLYNKISISKI